MQVWRYDGDVWPNAFINLGFVASGIHKFSLYGAENCCDGIGGAWFFDRGGGGWQLLTTPNLKKLCGALLG